MGTEGPPMNFFLRELTIDNKLYTHTLNTVRWWSWSNRNGELVKSMIYAGSNEVPYFGTLKFAP